MTQLPTDPERRRAIDDLFDGAVEQPREQRDAWLRGRCGDADLRREVQALLDAYDRPDGLLDRQALAVAAPLLATPDVERTIGPYRVLRELGRGGMGVVYLADRVDGHYRHRVAIKVLRNSPDAEELHRRFLAERQILASLNHPNIAQLLDGGVTDAQLPFLVMEYVDGVPITNYCDRQRLSIEERLRLFHDVCAAVHHAHQNLVIHRDIKPSNILVTEDRRVKLLDFGIAKLLNPTLGPADQPMTRTEWRVMTPEYASPEQVRGDALTTASDVYALGVVLYELLCGRRPHRITGGSPHELAALISQREPHLPSVAVTRSEAARPDNPASEPTPEAIAATRGLAVEKLRRRLRGDLDAIVMMALRKESARRYGSADLLWEDVQRHLEGLPVIADHGTRWYRTRKFLGRHRLQTIAAGAITLSLIGGASVAMRQAAVANRERARAEQALGQSKEVTDFLVRLFRTPAPPGATRDQVTARDMLVTGTARIEQLSSQPLVQAQMLDALGRVNDQLGRFDEAEQMLRRALDLRRAQLGDRHLDVAATLMNLSSVLRLRGRADEARQLASEALDIQERVLGPKHLDVALTMRRMSDLNSDAAVAESLVRSALAIQRAAGAPGRMEVTNTNAALVDLLIRRGAHAEAESLLRENLEVRRRIAGPDHRATANSMMLLANYLQEYRNDPVAAESLYTGALGILRRETVQDLPNLFAVLSGLTGLAEKRGDYVRAESIAREALEVQRRIWGPEHPMTIDAHGMIAEQLAHQRRYAEAESIQTEALTIMERTVGPRHSRVGRALAARAGVRTAWGRARDAEQDLRRALAIFESQSSSRDRWVGALAALLAESVARRGAQAESNALFERAASILRPLPQQRASEFVRAYSALADHFKARNQSGDEEHFRRLAQSP